MTTHGRYKNNKYSKSAKGRLNRPRFRAKRDGLEFTITHEHYIIPEFCPVLGIPIDVNASYRSDNSPSLDRFDNKKGYTPDNIRIISMRANRIKGDATIEEMRRVLEYMEGIW